MIGDAFELFGDESEYFVYGNSQAITKLCISSPFWNASVSSGQKSITQRVMANRYVITFFIKHIREVRKGRTTTINGT